MTFSQALIFKRPIFRQSLFPVLLKLKVFELKVNVSNLNTWKLQDLKADKVR